MLTDDPAKVHVSFETATGAVVGAGRYSRYGTLRAASAALLPTRIARHYLHATQVVADADQQLAAIAGAHAREIVIVVTVLAPPPTALYLPIPFWYCNTIPNVSRIDSCNLIINVNVHPYTLPATRSQYAL
jgi:hypothetical protein